MTRYDCQTDEELLELLKNSDEEAFTELFDRHWERISMYVSRVIKCRDDAQDIVQEIFISIWRRRGDISLKSTFLAYLLKSARNLSIRYIEKNINRENFVESLSEQMQSVDLSAISALELQELEAKVDQAIAKLPAKMQQVYHLSRRENLSYKDIAAQLGIAETTVKKQVSNALKQIRSEIETLSATSFMLAFFF
ncbi:RNA polymerase sigma factor [Dyadobacter frigoris]|uniref:RNA polymerase sigma-70 factor n=1 Tax=Dyadobacter frigoris TaxID=2576211 RepID=A0A4U6DCV6_9BACT|nr:RNA polymerase sigma-70 factor [Dyadobacter frigoris]TKT92204.1 RNA polymerase sigma-70 factor [Dyadobacter frigoris]GLU53375.1 RNA polymerase sigma-70 factor [Dyadobacter frigoris]